MELMRSRNSASCLSVSLSEDRAREHDGVGETDEHYKRSNMICHEIHENKMLS